MSKPVSTSNGMVGSDNSTAAERVRCSEVVPSSTRARLLARRPPPFTPALGSDIHLRSDALDAEASSIDDAWTDDESEPAVPPSRRETYRPSCAPTIRPPLRPTLRVPESAAALRTAPHAFEGVYSQIIGRRR